jgi:hypothetical protein
MIYLVAYTVHLGRSLYSDQQLGQDKHIINRDPCIPFSCTPAGTEAVIPITVRVRVRVNQTHL